MRYILSLGLLLALGAAPAAAQEATEHLEIKYVRDSEEWAALTRQVFRVATQAVHAAAPRAPQERWVVVLDIDETGLDNSLFQFELAAYGISYTEPIWEQWVARRASPPVPGALDFVAGVRRLGGRIAWISNRSAAGEAATRDNLRMVGLWSDDDRLCVLSDSTYRKPVRRAEVVSGNGRCSWPGQPMTVVAYVGDQMSDFPASGESDADAGSDAAFGVRFFLLPQPMYGAWVRARTRR